MQQVCGLAVPGSGEGLGWMQKNAMLRPASDRWEKKVHPAKNSSLWTVDNCHD